MDKKKGADGRAAYIHDLRELVLDSTNDRWYVIDHSGKGSVLFVWIRAATA